MQKELKILAVEDEPAAVALINHELRKAHFSFHTKRVESKAQFVKAIQEQPPDLILSDGALPEMTGYTALAIARDMCPDTPFIFVTGSLGEEKAIETLKNGASDYVLKNRLYNLAPCVQRALREADERTRRKEMELALKESEERFRMLVEGIKDYGIFMLSPTGRVANWNAGAQRICGYSTDEIVGRHFSEFYPPEESGEGAPDRALTTAGATGRFEEEGWRLRKGGIRFWANVMLSALRDGSGRLRGYVHVVRDITERKDAQQALRQSEARKTAIVETALDAIISIDHTGIVREWNPAAEKIFHYPHAAAIGRKIDELIIPAGLREIYREGLAEYLMTGVGSLLGRPIELTAIRSDQTELLVELAITRIPAQEPPLYSCFIHDITERKAAETALRKSEERYRLLVDNVQDYAIYLLDSAGRVTTWNSGAERIEGYRAEDIIGRHIACLFTREDAERGVPDEILRVATVEGRCESEGWRVRRDGSRYWVNMIVTALRDENNRVGGFAKIAHDVTELKRATEALRKSEQTYRTIMANIPNGGVALFDPELRHLLVDGMHPVKALGLTQEEVAGQTIFEVFPRDIVADLELVYRAALNGTRITTEFVLGQNTYILNALPLCNDEQRIYGGLAVWIDITDRKRAEDQVRQLNIGLEQRVLERTTELAEANKELEAFSFSVSHDLRAPVLHIQAFAEMLREKTAASLDKEGREFLDIIAASSRRMGGLIEGLLEFSRMGRTEMHQLPIDLGELVRSLREQLEPESRGRNVEWMVEPLPVVCGDPTLLRQVLINLLSNALKYTRTRTVARIEVGCLDHPEEFVIFVRDNGVGFDMAYAHRLFGVFQRLHRAEDFEGTGVGLANVQRIIHRHGGRVWADAVADRGASFYFSLPKSKSNGQAGSAACSSAAR